jgi:hypothetical protein
MQLLTEHYMVQFLLHNTLGPAIRDAWKGEQETQGDSYYGLDMPEPKP